MILTVTPNPALDVTYHLDEVVWDGSNRVERISARAGGKGLNVARVLTALGIPATVLGPLGGRTGDGVREDLAQAGPRDATVPVTGETRRTTTVVDAAAGETTVFNEAGPELSAGEWAALCEAFDRLLPQAHAVALCGSLPPGVPTDAYADLVRRARDAGVPVLLDTSGPALHAGLAAGPDLVKPNADELREATGESDPARAVAALSAQLRAAGGDAVVASFGPEGLLAATAAGWWRARLPYAIQGNPTGAGDAGVAALLAGLTAGRPWPDRLAEAVAWSASAVAAPVAGSVDRTTYVTARAHVLVGAVEPPHGQRDPGAGTPGLNLRPGTAQRGGAAQAGEPAASLSTALRGKAPAEPSAPAPQTPEGNGHAAHGHR
ncbi:1-phosphofructokinase family hexose kinase [Yinghuangia seranimata]|uniref:1-phosphofructokinase family hexose kinase n=1 Tax=Yinghuangia seranimata TaxID=408067 RepID=UPI0031BA29AA